MYVDFPVVVVERRVRDRLVDDGKRLIRIRRFRNEGHLLVCLPVLHQPHFHRLASGSGNGEHAFPLLVKVAARLHIER